MSNLENANSSLPVSPQPLRTWDFVETAFVCLIAYGVYTLTSELALAVVLGMHDGTKTLSPAQIQAHGAAYIIASQLTVAVIWGAIRMARRDFAEYLALNWPSSRELFRVLAITAIPLLAESVAGYVGGVEEISSDPYVKAMQANGFFVFLVGGCIAVPIMEEFVLRGFMFRGWSQSFLRPRGAIVLTSVLWAMMHTQYDWFGQSVIFVTGLVLGHIRWRSNSTWLTVMAHSAINIFIFLAMGLGF
jgi:membrane protease YdiL (CAAX protease family)